MRLLLIMVIILIVLIAFPLTAIIGLSRVGHPLIEVPQLSGVGFGTCEGKPCFMNIIPGETLWNKVDSLLQVQNKDKGIIATTERRRSRPGFLEIYQSTPDYEPDRVGVIIVQVNAPLWEVLQVFGKPCSVRLVSRTGETFSRFRLLYPFVEVYGNPREGKLRSLTELDPMLRVDTILMRAKLNANESERGSCRPTTDDWFELFGSWQGFAPLEYYRRNAGH